MILILAVRLLIQEFMIIIIILCAAGSTFLHYTFYQI
jgi:hypothetical protein